MQQQTNFSLSLLTLGLLPLLSVIGNSMFIPILPNIQAELGLTTYEAGLLLTFFTIPAAFVIPFVGVFADRLGRKNIVVMSLLLLLLGNFLAIFAQSYPILLLARIIQGLGSGGTASLAMVIVGDRYEDKERSRALGILEVSNSLGKIISPIIGSIFLIVAWVGTFYFYFIVSLLALIGVVVFIAKDDVTKQKVQFYDYVKQIQRVFIRDWRWLLPIYLASGVSLFVLYGMLFFLSYEISLAYEVTSIVKGVILAIPLAGLTIASYVSGKQVGTKLNRMKQALVVGLLILISSFSALIFISTVSLQIILLALAATGIGLFLPAANTAITSSVRETERGVVVSLYNMTRFFGVAFAPVVFSVWMNEPLEMHFLALLVIGASLVCLISFWSCIPIFKDCPAGI